MAESIKVAELIPATAAEVFAAWMDSAGHTAMTGGEATVEACPGGRFTAWDGYIEGTTVELEPGRRVVQRWRTTEFPEAAPDSHLEVRFEPVGRETRVSIVHSEIPDGQGTNYESGWFEYYFVPMKGYFEALKVN